MSTATDDRLSDAQLSELAEMREAGGTEPEPEHDTEHDTEPDTEPEPEPEPASDVAAEKLYATLDKENTRHGKRVGEIMGADFAALTECPCCQIPGYVFPFDHTSVDDAMRRGAVEQYFGDAPRTLKANPKTSTCDLCDGEGFLLTGGKREGYTEEPCEKCGGQGWIRNDAPPSPHPQLAAVPSPSVPQPWAPPGAPAKPELYLDYSDMTWKLPA